MSVTSLSAFRIVIATPKGYILMYRWEGHIELQKCWQILYRTQHDIMLYSLPLSVVLRSPYVMQWLSKHMQRENMLLQSSSILFFAIFQVWSTYFFILKFFKFISWHLYSTHLWIQRIELDSPVKSEIEIYYKKWRMTSKSKEIPAIFINSPVKLWYVVIITWEYQVLFS